MTHRHAAQDGPWPRFEQHASVAAFRIHHKTAHAPFQDDEAGAGDVALVVDGLPRQQTHGATGSVVDHP